MSLQLRSTLFNPPEEVWKRDTLFLESAMGTGKSKQLLNHINTRLIDESILIISFRVLLCEEVNGMLNDFVLYSDIKGPIFRQDRVIVQIDSLWRIARAFDVIIIDECSSTLGRIAGGDMDPCASEAACNYLSDALRVLEKHFIFADAYLSNLVKKVFYKGFSKRNTCLVTNKSDIHKDKVRIAYASDADFKERFLGLLREGVNVFLVSNSKRIIDEMSATARGEGFSTKSITSDSCVGSSGNITADWNQYNVVAISPRIIAGISFEKEHFGATMGIFTPRSCCAALCMQMLMRVRNVTEIHTCVLGVSFSEDKYPTTYKGIREQMKNIKQLTKMKGSRGQMINYETGAIKQDLYCKLFIETTREHNKSKIDFCGELDRLLDKQGIRKAHTVHGHPLRRESNKRIRTLFKNYGKEATREQLAITVSDATPIIQEQGYQQLKCKRDIGEEEIRSMAKYYFKRTFGVFARDAGEYQKYICRRRQYKNLKLVLGLIPFMLDVKVDQHAKLIAEQINSASCSSKQLHNNTNTLKIAHCLSILDIMGFPLWNNYVEVPFDRMNFEGLRGYYINNHGSLDACFGNRTRREWTTILNQKNESWKRHLMRSANQRLKNCLGVNFALSDKYGTERFYFLQGLEDWDWKHYIQRKKVDNKWLSRDEGTEDRYDRIIQPYDGRVRYYHIPDQPWLIENRGKEHVQSSKMGKKHRKAI